MLLVINGQRKNHARALNFYNIFSGKRSCPSRLQIEQVCLPQNAEFHRIVSKVADIIFAGKQKKKLKCCLNALPNVNLVSLK